MNRDTGVGGIIGSESPQEDVVRGWEIRNFDYNSIADYKNQIAFMDQRRGEVLKMHRKVSFARTYFNRLKDSKISLGTDKITGLESKNISQMAYDDGFGNINGVCS